MTYYVCSGLNEPAFIEVDEGQGFGTGQPTTEEFATADPAALRAQELGYPFPVFSIEEEFFPGDYATYEGFLFQALAEIEPYTPEDFPPINNPAWRRITPAN